MYESIKMKQKLMINDIFTIHYFEYMSDFSFPGEIHDFWELVCVDKGEVCVRANTSEHIIKQGEIIFHQPNEFHSISANGRDAPNLIVISFKSHSKAISFFANKLFTVSNLEKALFANIIMEARNTYITKLEDPYYTKLIHSKNIPFGSEQLIKIYLESILIHLYRRYHCNTLNSQNIEIINNTIESKLYEQIHTYLIENIQSHLTIEKICNDNLISRSKLQKIVKNQHNCGVIEYYTKLKIEVAKQLIRDRKMNFSQISDYISYNSIHYFSRQFKKVTGMSPSQYASSIKGMSDNVNPNYKIF